MNRGKKTMKINSKFPEKRVLITGAGSGLGRALCLEFAARGWRIAVTDIDRKRIAETADLAREAGGAPLAMPLDVTRPGDFTRALASVKKKWGGLDVLVNNAGVAAGGLMEKIPLAKWDWIIGINAKSIIHGCRAAIPLLKEQGRGHIVNIASSAAIASLPEMGSYNFTKAAALSLSETLRLELSPHGIGVTAVCPSFFRTNLLDRFTSPDARQRILAEKMFDKSRTTAGAIALLIIKWIEKNRFYLVTPVDGKLVWLIKRRCPELYFRAMAWLYRKGLIERYLGVPPEGGAT